MKVQLINEVNVSRLARHMQAELRRATEELLGKKKYRTT